ncbi:MAG: hypothetical protein IKM24_07960 [Clostridia bacterium]|nr:hypothetical protein [Clostridia bacterium]
MKTKTETKQVAVTADAVREAARILEKYRSGKASFEQRIVDNEMWFRLRHWDRSRKNDNRKNASAWLFNSIINKHADFMDAIPECTVLAREASDVPTAEMLSSVVPVVLENNGFENVYSDACMYKLKNGTACYAVLWNAQTDNGLGDIEITQVDLLNLFWEPGIRNLQESRNLFHVRIADNDVLLEEYPFLAGKLGQPLVDVKQYANDDQADQNNKSAVVDWYYKRRVNGKTVLHYCKFVGSEILFASENEPLYANGFYEHGQYPFVLDTLFKEEGTPVGFGFIDVMKDAQEAIDVLGTEILRNARMSARRRYFARTDGAVNEKEFADWNKDFVHVSGSSLGEESLREITTQPLSGVYLSVLQAKIDELKETSANRDFVQGGTMGGVTSGFAISALQESGNKVARDMINASYRAFSQVCTLVIELIRQFYAVPRLLRITDPNGAPQYVSFDHASMLARPQTDDFGIYYGDRLPVFDVRVKAHKQNPFSRSAQNQDAINFFQMGMFDPAKYKQALACLDMLDIENKDKIAQSIARNGQQYEAAQTASLAAVETGGTV